MKKARSSNVESLESLPPYNEEKRLEKARRFFVFDNFERKSRNSRLLATVLTSKFAEKSLAGAGATRQGNLYATRTYSQRTQLSQNWHGRRALAPNRRDDTLGQNWLLIGQVDLELVQRFDFSLKKKSYMTIFVRSFLHIWSLKVYGFTLTSNLRSAFYLQSSLVNCGYWIYARLDRPLSLIIT